MTSPPHYPTYRRDPIPLRCQYDPDDAVSFHDIDLCDSHHYEGSTPRDRRMCLRCGKIHPQDNIEFPEVADESQ